MLSAVLKHNKKQVALLDAQALNWPWSKMQDYYSDYRPDLIGFSVMTCEFPRILSVLPWIKADLPHTKIVLGGPHVTGEPAGTLDDSPEVDFVVLGEGEETILELVRALDNGNPLSSVKGIAYREGSEIRVNPRRDLIKDLDGLPYADWAELPLERYWSHSMTRRNHVKIFGSRGCLYNCIFCCAPLMMGRGIRRRSQENIKQELEMLYDCYGVRDVGFGDSVFTADTPWAMEVCRAIMEIDRPLIWRCNVRANGINEELVRMMKESGCVHVSLGVESGDVRMLKLMQRGETLDQIREAVRLFKKHGILVFNSYVIGLPGETKESINNTLTFAKELRSHHAGFNTATPFPGTEFYRQARHEGLSVKNWAAFNISDISYVPSGMTRMQLQSALKRIAWEYYLRPTYFLDCLRAVRSWLSLRIFLRSGWRLLLKKHRLGNLPVENQTSP
jgi:anaerobic magnesium-protoporphyrin IX monomethyl ester cyclase